MAPEHLNSRPEGPFPEELAELKSIVKHLVFDPQSFICNREKILALPTSQCHGDCSIRLYKMINDILTLDANGHKNSCYSATSLTPQKQVTEPLAKGGAPRSVLLLSGD